MIDINLSPDDLTAHFSGICWHVRERDNPQSGVTKVCAANAEEAKLAALGRLPLW